MEGKARFNIDNINTQHHADRLPQFQISLTVKGLLLGKPFLKYISSRSLLGCLAPFTSTSFTLDSPFNN
jgi:hypothetical protein